MRIAGAAQGLADDDQEQQGGIGLLADGKSINDWAGSG